MGAEQVANTGGQVIRAALALVEAERSDGVTVAGSQRMHQAMARLRACCQAYRAARIDDDPWNTDPPLVVETHDGTRWQLG